MVSGGVLKISAVFPELIHCPDADSYSESDSVLFKQNNTILCIYPDPDCVNCRLKQIQEVNRPGAAWFPGSELDLAKNQSGCTAIYATMIGHRRQLLGSPIGCWSETAMLFAKKQRTRRVENFEVDGHATRVRQKEHKN